MSLEEILAIVSAGDAIHNVAEHMTRFYRRPDLVYRHIHDGPPLSWIPVWHTESENDLIRVFRRVLEDLREARLRKVKESQASG